jgi:hypothetical protein
MTITRTLNSITSNNQTDIQETTTNTADPASNQVTTTRQGGMVQYNGTSGPTVTKTYHQLITLTAGAFTLDLTAMVDGSVTIDATGLTLRELFAIASDANLNPIVIKPGVSNGYTGWVGTNGLLLTTAKDANKLGPLYGGIAVDGTHKTIDFTGTGTQSVLLELMFG